MKKPDVLCSSLLPECDILTPCPLMTLGAICMELPE